MPLSNRLNSLGKTSHRGPIEESRHGQTYPTAGRISPEIVPRSEAGDDTDPGAFVVFSIWETQYRSST